MADIKETDEERELRELDAQIKAEREKTAKAEAQRTLRAKRAQLEEAKREAEAAAIIAELEAEHGTVGQKIAVFQTSRGVVAVKRALGIVWHRYVNSKMKDDDLDDLIAACRLYPADAEAFDDILEELPALKITLGNKIGELYGFKAKEAQGK